MHMGARTPEELETMLEDAYVMRDDGAVGALFREDAVLSDGKAVLARGRPRIVQATRMLWAREQRYVAGPTHVLQIHRTALVAGPFATSVARRARDGAWRYTIALLHGQPHKDRSTTT